MTRAQGMDGRLWLVGLERVSFVPIIGGGATKVGNTVCGVSTKGRT